MIFENVPHSELSQPDSSALFRVYSFTTHYKLIEELTNLTEPKQEALTTSDRKECLMKMQIQILHLASEFLQSNYTIKVIPGNMPLTPTRRKENHSTIYRDKMLKLLEISLIKYSCVSFSSTEKPGFYVLHASLNSVIQLLFNLSRPLSPVIRIVARTNNL